MQKTTIVVRAEWDAEARVFVATSEDVPGLVAEAGTLDDLTSKLKALIPELLELNGCSGPGDNRYALDEVPLLVMAQQLSKVRLHA